jgi:hypothetical protein
MSSIAHLDRSESSTSRRSFFSRRDVARKFLTVVLVKGGPYRPGCFPGQWEANFRRDPTARRTTPSSKAVVFEPDQVPSHNAFFFCSIRSSIILRTPSSLHILSSASNLSISFFDNLWPQRGMATSVRGTFRIVSVRYRTE